MGGNAALLADRQQPVLVVRRKEAAALCAVGEVAAAVNAPQSHRVERCSALSARAGAIALRGGQQSAALLHGSRHRLRNQRTRTQSSEAARRGGGGCYCSCFKVEAAACAQGVKGKGVDRKVRLGGAMHSEALSLPSRCSALCPPAPPSVMPLTAKQGCCRSYGTCTGRIPAVWPGCRIGWLARASPASATATPATTGQAVRVCKTAEARADSGRKAGRGALLCGAPACRRLEATLCVSAPARASRITGACMAGSRDTSETALSASSSSERAATMLPNMATKNKRKRRKEGRKCQKVTEIR